MELETDFMMVKSVLEGADFSLALIRGVVFYIRNLGATRFSSFSCLYYPCEYDKVAMLDGEESRPLTLCLGEFW
ncbi:hypothetical protein BAE44_0002918 [Dichanthelium oligosanthes]|uniref:Uncharacterized protein n=1 Tax=Dichanthelium oligosanthes TaxID=888268 RepID=A0A1E5WFA0_9POAL|nr:hypothetical protein BAE44_0002918 [Dichanthelium oligosanthes]